MDLTFTSEEEAFRAEVRTFIERSMPPKLAEKAKDFAHFSMDEVMEWHRVLADKGWVAPHWPAEFGGPGWDAAKRFIFDEEITLAGAPPLSRAKVLIPTSPNHLALPIRGAQSRGNWQ